MHKYNEKGEVKREYISNCLFLDGRYDRMSKYGTKPFNDETNWEDFNHFEEEINDYEKWFNELMMNEKVENHGKIHIDNNCFCSNCIIEQMLSKYKVKDYQLTKMNEKHYIVIKGKMIPLERYFNSFY